MARKMKDSGIEWIGEIPEGWSKNKVIRLFDIIGSGTTPKNITSDFPVVNWIQSGDITGSFMPTCKNVISANLLSQYSALKVYPAPFIIIAMYGASVGNASISLIDGCVNQACCVLSSPSCNLHYAFYVIKSAQSYLVRKAVGGGQPNISQETIKQLWLPLPPLSTQDIIVRNLDATCSKIDDLLSSVHASIEEYKKLKQAVITQAVTKGVRGEREMKDSGVEWIGEIPTSCSICKLKYLLKNPLKYGANESGIPYSDSLPRYIRITDITPDGNLKCTGKLSLSEESAKDYILEDGDILFARSGATVGKTFIYYQSYGRSAYAGYLIKASLNNKVSPKFVYYYTCSSLYEVWKNSIFIQSTIQNIGADRYANLPVPVPKTLQEQEEIADYLDAKCAEIDGLIAKKEQLVKELESYKKSLIYEVVTGKREV